MRDFSKYKEINKTLNLTVYVVESPLSRALGSFFIELTRPVAPTKLFDGVEKAVEWLKT